MNEPSRNQGIEAERSKMRNEKENSAAPALASDGVVGRVLCFYCITQSYEWDYNCVSGVVNLDGTCGCPIRVWKMALNRGKWAAL